MEQIQPTASRACQREDKESMATEECTPLARKNEEKVSVLADYILQRYGSSTAHHRGGSNAAARSLPELAKLCRADGCARAEQSYHSHSSAPAAVASSERGITLETTACEDARKREPSQRARGDTDRHQTTTTVLRSLLSLVLATSAPSVAVPTRESGGGDGMLSDNHSRLKPSSPPPPPTPPQPLPSQPPPQSPSGNGGDMPSDHHCRLQPRLPPPPPPPPSQSQLQPQPPSGIGDDMPSDNHCRLQPLPPPPSPPPQPQLQPPLTSGNGDNMSSDNHGGLNPLPPPPPPPPPLQSKPQLPPVKGAVAATATAYKVGAVHPIRSGNGGADPNNYRLKLFGGVLRLLEEVVVGKGGGGNDDEDSEWMRQNMGQESKDVFWDIVVAILSDSWSEIRKMGAKHARVLAMAVGSAEARVLYLRIASRCKGVLLHPRCENDREWTRIHGFLLGMRATIEGAAETSIPSQSTASINRPNDDNITTSEVVELWQHQNTGIDVQFDGGRLVESSSRREAPALADFVVDVVQACEEKGRSRKRFSASEDGTELSMENMPCEADRGPSGRHLSANPLVCISDETQKTSEKTRTAPKPQATPQAEPLPPPPQPPSLTAPSSTELAFSCLSHRQGAVREAAVGLLCALASSLGLQAALVLYERTIVDLQHEKEGAGNLATRGRGGACGGNAKSGLKGAGSLAEARRNCDRVSGLLGLLERIVGVVPPETVGESWGRLFPLLRSYIGHPEASLRQGVGAVLLRIATARGNTPASSSTRVTPQHASTISDPAPPAESLPHVACHTSARIVLWAFSSELNEPSDEAERTPHHPEKSITINPRGETDILQNPGKESDLRLSGDTRDASPGFLSGCGSCGGNGRSLTTTDLRRGGLPTKQPGDLHRNIYVGGGEVDMQPGLVAKGAGRETALERQEGAEGSEKEPPPHCSGGTPMPASNEGESFAAGATVGENNDGGSCCGGGGGGRVTSWEKHEGVLMVCEGVLKSLVERNMAEVIFSGGSGSRAPLAAAVDTPSAMTAARMVVGSAAASHCCGWPISLVNAIPSLSDLLLSLARLAEDALFESGLGLGERPASYAAGDDDKGCPTGGPSLALGASSGGSLELWRAGSQILPSIARAMVWWNPAAIRGACKHAAQTKADNDSDSARQTSPSLLPLRRRTRLSVACELLRASVRFARHLAETLTDQAAGEINHTSSRHIVSSDSGANTARQTLQTGTADVDVTGVTPGALVGSAAWPRSQGPPCDSTVVPVAEANAVSVTNRERWGGSTEGIADSGVGGSAFSRLPMVTTSASAGSTIAAERAGVNKHAASDTVERIVRDTLALCCEAPPLLARALAEAAEDKETPAETSDRTSHQSTGRLVNTLSGPNPSEGKGAHLISPEWVFTGVVEAMILAESFRATTICLPFSKTPSGNDHPRDGHAERCVDSSPTFVDVETGGEVTTPLPDPCVSVAQHLPTTHVAIPSMVEQQLHLLHQVVFPTPPAAGGEAKTQPTAVRGAGPPYAAAAAAVSHEHFKRDVSERESLSGGGETAAAAAVASESSSHGYSITEEGRLPDDPVEIDPVPTKFAIPFSWGSLPLVRVAPLAGRIGSRKTSCLGHRRGKDSRIAAVGGSGESSATRPSETVRKAAQLDRLLSARVVRALPGYVSSLPPQRGIGIVPTLLRWLELHPNDSSDAVHYTRGARAKVSDHNLRWISVTSLEAHELLLSAIGIALQDAGVVDRLDEDESHPLSEVSWRPLHGPSPAPVGGGTASSSTVTTASATRQQQQQQQQQLQQQQQQQQQQRQQQQQQQQQRQQQQHAETVMYRVVETLSRMFGSPARLAGSSNLFCHMCKIAGDAVDILAQLRTVVAAAERRHYRCFQMVDQYHRSHTEELDGKSGSSQNRFDGQDCSHKQNHRSRTDELHGKSGPSQNRENRGNREKYWSHRGGEGDRCGDEKCSSVSPPRLFAPSRATARSEIAPNRDCRDTSILLDVTHADPQAQAHLRGGSPDHDGSAASTSEARKRQHYTREKEVQYVDALASCVRHDEAVEITVTSLLRAVAEHLARWYKVGTVDKEREGGTCGSLSGCVQTEARSSPILTSIASGRQLPVDEESGGRGRGTSGGRSSSSSGGCASDWDDWDDDDSGDDCVAGEARKGGEGGGGGVDVGDRSNLKGGSVGYSSSTAIDAADLAVLRSIAALMNSVAVFMTTMATTMSRNNSARSSSGAVPRAEGITAPTATSSPSCQQNSQPDGPKQVSPSSRECSDEARSVTTPNVTTGRGLVDASSSSINSSGVSDQTRHQGKATIDANDDGDGALLRLFEERFLGVLPTGHRDALFLAWRSGFGE